MSDAPKPNNPWSAPGSSHNEDAAGNTYNDGQGQDYGAPQAQRPPQAPQAYNTPQTYDSAPGHGNPQGYQPGYQPGYGGPQRVTWSQVKPGIVPIRPLGVGEMIGGAFSLLRFNPKSTLGLTFVLALVAGVVMFGLGALVDALNIGLLNDYIGFLPMATLTSSLALQVVIALVVGPITVVTIHAVKGRKLSPSQAWTEFRPHLGRYLAFYLILLVGVVALTASFLGLLYLITTYTSDSTAPVLIMMALGLAALILYAYLMIKLIAAVPAVSNEDLGPLQAIARSWKLLDGGFWRSFGAYILMYIITQFLASVIVFPISIVTGFGAAFFIETTGGLSVITAVGTTVAQVLAILVTAPLSGALVGLIYVNQRIRKEGYDIEILGSVNE